MKNIDMGHDQLVDIVSDSDGWSLFFHEAGRTGHVAPSLDEIEVLGIDAAGTATGMRLGRGRDVSSVRIGGDLSETARIRLHVVHGDHLHKREVDGTAAAPVVSRMTLADGTVVVASRPSSTRVLLARSNGAAPAPSELTVEAVMPKPLRGQVVELIAVKGADAASVAASGKVDGTAFVRFTCRGETLQVVV